MHKRQSQSVQNGLVALIWDRVSHSKDFAGFSVAVNAGESEITLTKDGTAFIITVVAHQVEEV